MNVDTEPVAVFRKDAGMAILAVLLVGLPSLFILFGAFAGGFNFTLLLIGIGMAAFAALVVATSYHASVLLFKDHLVHKKLFGTKEVRLNEHTRFYHRREVHSMIAGVPTSRHNYLTISEGRTRLKLNSEICDDILRDLIVAFELEVILPALLKAYGGGQMVDFDVVRLQLGTLHYKKRTLPLNEITRMTLEAGEFAVNSGPKKRVFFKLDVSRIANMHSLFQLLEHLTAPTSPSHAGGRA